LVYGSVYAMNFMKTVMSIDLSSGYFIRSCFNLEPVFRVFWLVI
jgi:hypothetical protein